MTEVDARSRGPVRLRAGALTTVLRDGELHDVRLDGITVLDRVHIAVRDRDWTTVPVERDDPCVTVEPDSFEVSYRARTSSDDVDFAYQVTISGHNGTIRFAMTGYATRDFLANRLGFALLHPQQLAGTQVTVHTPDGEPLRGENVRFPERIAAHQPFPEMTGMSYETGTGMLLRLSFDGELFETEDQRNWTDASFKTYCTPLRLPRPRLFAMGKEVRQTVTMTAAPAAGRTPSADVPSCSRRPATVPLARRWWTSLPSRPREPCQR